ncbi:MAG: permease-like cell division protein FtsX [Candidatus Absconditabacteria bacterium]|nr:permease-like cell division protein FtsX [Candidatus Absconditabacteria bacterium]MDD3868216.1 permease-like cell division protein FtsX [Candidatus Absconditabacteria bacterium]MDD4714657.1 permease-like cell division protein FtsX [Candidatus Absconditabacteria bacterium]
MKKRLPSPKLFWDDIKSIFKAYRAQMIWISVLSGFLLFLLNILIGVSFYGNTFNDSLRDKLGMYFYIKDVPEKEEQIYKQVMDLKEKLQAEGLQVSFSTKEDALNLLEKRLPDLTGSFEKFGISNPLPATLYVTFQDQSQYTTLQQIMNENKNIILNIQDLSQIENLQKQENRMLNVIKLSNFVQALSWTLIFVIAAVIVSFAVFFLRGIFTTFRNDIQVKKLLGATKTQIIQPFLRIILYAILGGFAISFLLTFGSLAVFDYYMAQVFEVTLLSQVASQGLLFLGAFLTEIILLISLLMAISYYLISSLHKKLR